MNTYRVIFIALWTALLTCFAAADLRTSFWFVVGSICAWILTRVLYSIGWKQFLFWGLASIIALFVFIFIAIFGVLNYIPSSTIEDYRAELIMYEPATQQFRLIEQFKVNWLESVHEKFGFNYQPGQAISLGTNEGTFKLEEKIIEPQYAGLIAKEISWHPLNSKNGQIDLMLSASLRLRGPLCGYACPPATVTIRDLPSGSFFGARYSNKVTVSEYLGTETVRFTVDKLESGIKIAYLPRLLRFTKPVIGVFYKAGSIGGLLIALSTAVVGFLFLGVIKPLLEKILQERVSEALGINEKSKR